MTGRVGGWLSGTGCSEIVLSTRECYLTKTNRDISNVRCRRHDVVVVLCRAAGLLTRRNRLFTSSSEPVVLSFVGCGLWAVGCAQLNLLPRSAIVHGGNASFGPRVGSSNLTPGTIRFRAAALDGFPASATACGRYQQQRLQTVLSTPAERV